MLNTADYCYVTSSQVNRSIHSLAIHGKIVAGGKNQRISRFAVQIIDRFKQRKRFVFNVRASKENQIKSNYILIKNTCSLITNSIQTLVRQLNSGLSNALQSMSRIPWSTMQHVGDQSEYVTTIGAALNGSVSLIRKLIRDQKHFKWFCDKFVE